MKEIKITIDIKIEGLDEVKKEETVCKENPNFRPDLTVWFRNWTKPVTEYTVTFIETMALCANTRLLADGKISINKVYELLGLDPIESCKYYGWKLDKEHIDENPIKLRLVNWSDNYWVVDLVEDNVTKI